MPEEVISQLSRWGPGGCSPCTEAQAQAYCRSLTLGRYENFSVLSSLVPERLQEGVCAVYAFCRWADDLGDEVGDAAKSEELLLWWRGELDACFGGRATHPVFLSLRPMIDRHGLEPTEFHRLIDAFVQDQHVNRYRTWDQVVDYCTGSVDPVGRLVLRIAGADQSQEQLEHSDRVCTGLQLANHWQDVQRDLLERDRIYLPMNEAKIDEFESRLVTTIRQGHAPDPEFLEAYRCFIRALVERTRPMLECVQPLMASLEPDVRPMVWLFAAGGLTVLDLIEQSNCETALYRVKISKLRKASLVWKATRHGRVA